MYDSGKLCIEEFSPGHLTERGQRDKTGKTVGGKYAVNFYYTYFFVQGKQAMSEFQREFMSKHNMRNQVTLWISKKLKRGT